MKLGTETGSMTNHILSRSVIGQPEPEIGMGVTILAWTDRHAGTIEKVHATPGGKLLVLVREDTATRTDSNGMSESQVYAYERNPNGRAWEFRREPDGRWQEVRFSARARRYVKADGGGSGLRLGERRAYHDFSF